MCFIEEDANVNQAQSQLPVSYFSLDFMERVKRIPYKAKTTYEFPDQTRKRKTPEMKKGINILIYQ